MNLAVHGVIQSRNQADRIAGCKASVFHNPSPNFGDISLGWMPLSVHKCTADSNSSLWVGSETSLCGLHMPTLTFVLTLV